MNLNEIRKLIKIFEKSKIGELEIIEDTYKIKMSRGNQLSQHPSNINGSGPTYILPSTSVVQGQSNNEQLQTQGESDTTNQKQVESTNNYFEVRAPMVGTFYSAPAPDAEPYVGVGDAVSSGQTLCIIEAMKLMNEIQSEIDGKIAKILVENAQPVEYNQVLFYLDRS